MLPNAPLPASILEALLGGLSLRVFWKDTASRYLGCNQAFAADAGVASPADIIGKMDVDLVWKDQAAGYVADDTAVMTSGVARLRFEEPQATPAGAVIWVRTSKLPLRGPGGAVVGVLGIYEDVTEQHELAARLELRERHLRTLLDALPFMAWLKDEQSRFLAVNQPFARGIGGTPDQLVGKTDLDVWPEELARGYREDDRTVMNGGQPKLFEEPVRVGSGWGWFETYKAPMTVSGRVVGTVGYARDITERRRRQDSSRWMMDVGEVQVRMVEILQDADRPFVERLEAALRCFEALPGLRAGPNARLLLPEADPLLGCGARVGHGLWHLGDPQAPAVSTIARCDRDVLHGHYLVPLRRASEHLGTLVLDTEVDPSTSPDRLDALRAVGDSLAKALDAERAARLLFEARRQAEEASQAKSRFLATMSHEIRTPLNGVLGMAQLLATETMSDDERRASAETILSSGRSLLRLLNDALDLSRVESGGLTLEISPFDGPKLLDEVARLFHEELRRHGLTLTTTWDGPRVLAGDGLRLRQMLGNLVSNAAKFTSEGGVRVSVRVTADDSGAQVEWSVTDTGVGVSPRDRVRLFHPFSQLDASTTRRFGGSGLGLSIVRHLAERMGGTVGVESGPDGRGSRFWFTTRLAIASAVPESTPPLGAKALALTGHRVLLAEDNPVNRVVAERLLKRHGLAVTSVEDGAHAVEQLCGAERPALVLMDCQMPELDGFEATRRVRAWETERAVQPVPIVALTASAFDEDRQRASASGMNDFLTKPLDTRALEATLARWLTPR